MTPSAKVDDLLRSTAPTAVVSLEELLTPNAVAAILGISPNTLPMWRWQRKGPPFIKLGDEPGAPIRYRRSDLMKWLAERSSVPQGEANHA